MYKYIWVKGKRYYWHSNYASWELARKQAKYYRKKNHSRYYIRKENGLYELYMDKTIGLWRT